MLQQEQCIRFTSRRPKILRFHVKCFAFWWNWFQCIHIILTGWINWIECPWSVQGTCNAIDDRMNFQLYNNTDWFRLRAFCMMMSDTSAQFMRPNLNVPRAKGVAFYYYCYYWSRFVWHINDSSRCYLSNFNFIFHVWNIYGFFISQIQKLGATNAHATLEFTNEINHLFRSWIAFTDWCIHIRTRIANIAQPDMAFAVCR